MAGVIPHMHMGLGSHAHLMTGIHAHPVGMGRLSGPSVPHVPQQTFVPRMPSIRIPGGRPVMPR